MFIVTVSRSVVFCCVMLCTCALDSCVCMRVCLCVCERMCVLLLLLFCVREVLSSVFSFCPALWDAGSPLASDASCRCWDVSGRPVYGNTIALYMHSFPDLFPSKSYTFSSALHITY